MVSSWFFIPLSIACPPALATDDLNFCASFKSAAQCYCTASGLPVGMCTNMGLLYTRMIHTFGSVERACSYQHNTSYQECLDDWKCYRLGGQNSQNTLCSGTGNACE